MKTKAVRIYGVDDLRLDEFELPAIKEDEILARVVSDSICIPLLHCWKVRTMFIYKSCCFLPSFFLL